MYNDVQKLLLEARGKIAQGWCKFHYRKRKSWLSFKYNYCATGALLFSAEDRDNIIFTRASNLLYYVSCALYNNRTVYYNDYIAKSKEDVLHLYDLAIKKAGED